MKEQQQSPAELARLQFCKFTYRERRIRYRTLDSNFSAHPGDHISCTPNVSLGTLDAFPIEVLHHILAQLDLLSLTNLQQVNHGARHAVTSLPRYHTINTHAPTVLRGIFGVSTGRWITLETLYQALCTAECASCGDFGGYLYLLTCTRVCFLCYTEHRDYLPMRSLDATRRFALARRLLNTNAIPQMRSRAGVYSDYSYPYGKIFRRSLVLVDERSLRKACLQRRLCSVYSRAPSSIEPQDDIAGISLRSMATVRAPWLDPSSQSAEWGAYCTGCEDEEDGMYVEERLGKSSLDYRRMFNVASFDAHLRQHGAIEQDRHASSTRNGDAQDG